MPNQRTTRAAERDTVAAALPPSIVDTTFADNHWWIKTAQGRNSLTWEIELADGSLLTSPKHRQLLRMCKLLVVVSATYGETRGRGRKGGKSLLSFYYCLKALIVWMSRRRLFSFRDLSPAHVVGYRNYVNNIKIADGETMQGLASGTRGHRFSPIKVLVYHADKFGSQGALALDTNETLDLLRVKTTPGAATKRIPDAKFERIVAAAIKTLEDARRRPPVDIDDQFYARAAGFIVIGAFVGMRISEILSIKRAAPLTVVALSRKRKLLKIAGTLFKTSRELLGEPAEWVAGWDDGNNPVRLAVDVLQELPNPAGYDRLFVPLVERELRYHDPILAQPTVHRSLHMFAETVANIPRSEWSFAPHQFRKTFARFVALSGPRAAFALMRHFKHVSIQMTERYFPNDPELINEIYEAQEDLIAERLDVIFGASRLGGIKGTQIAARNERFRGAAGATARRELIQMTLRDPRSSFRLSPYGICIYEAERAKCEGLVERVGLETCTECPNHAIDESHAPFWLEQLKAIEAAIEIQSRLGIVNLALHRQREQALQVLRELGMEPRGRTA